MAEPFEFTAETNILKALELDPRVGEALRKLGLKCVDKRGEVCVAAEIETLADAARFHEMNLEDILAQLKRLNVTPRSNPNP